MQVLGNEQKQQPQIDWHKLQAEYYLNEIVCQKYYNEYYHKGICFVTSVSSTIIKHSEVSWYLNFNSKLQGKKQLWNHEQLLCQSLKDNYEAFELTQCE